ncbi:hypothetical protein [Candidatus Nitronereus thalassa]|uniref:Uncharacterized protein n=1 Tax=Candidatus Nitronereus thalassa TaxID=3020898 RepID=A0ABU3K384_9BACT|nr:hypothetical protein [Candidatus Nitronereus thalassa]MDT7040855.1 hypothetical protein [Candidatus Nitronereus thalassa]
MTPIDRPSFVFEIIIAACVLVAVLAFACLSHAQTMVGWEPQANGMMAIYWDRNHDGSQDFLTWHVIRWHGHSALPLTVLVDQARRDDVYLFWLEEERDHYCYEVDKRPLFPVGNRAQNRRVP